MKKQLFLFLMTLLPMITMAYDAEIDGIYYDFSGTEATVTFGDNNYSGFIVIPSTVNYNDTEYSVTSIGNDAFYNCVGLISVTIPNSVTSISSGAFSWNSGLTSIKIPNSVMSIEGNPFDACSGLTSIVVEEGNTNYDSRNNCNAIIETSSNTLIAGCMNTTIPNSVTSIGDAAFYGCYDLTSITIPNSVTSIGEMAFYTCHGLTSISIPGSVKRIRYSTFWACSGLKSVTISDGVKSIETNAFDLCDGLISVTIPNSVTSIEDHAFSRCYNLTDFYCYAKVLPIIGSSSFGNTPIGNVTLHVPAVSIEAYRTTEPWSGFKEIVVCNDVDVEDQSIEASNSTMMEINVSNNVVNLVGFQMDLMLPEGVSIDKTSCSLSSRITDVNQELTIGKLESGAYRITSTSLSLTPISGNDGTLLNLKLTAEDGCIGGQAILSNIIFSTAESEKVVMSDKTFDISILYNLTYKVDGQVYKDTSVVYGTAITPLEEPTKEGYTFGGWSEIPETMPNHDVEITGNFTINKYLLTYMVDGEIVKSDSIEFNTAIAPLEEPAKEGYTFSGWSEIPETMPNHDVEITGRFYLYGDVNTDEAVDVVDVVDIARFVVATPSVSFREKLANLNFDNTVNIADAVTLVNFIAGDQNFARLMTPSDQYNYDYDQCQLLLLSNGTNALSLCLDGAADFTAFQFEVELPENTDITAMSINGQRMDDHEILYNKVEANRYRVAVLSLSNAIFKGNAGELLNISIDGLNTNEVSVQNIHFVTKNGTDITFDVLALSGTVTGIANVRSDESNGVIFDLQGRKLSKTQRGVNIVDGKKVIVK